MAKSTTTSAAPKAGKTTKSSGDKKTKSSGDKKPKSNVDANELKRLSAEIKKLMTEHAKLRKEMDALKLNGGKKAKKERDPNAPKKSKNGYMFYCAENRERVKKSGEDIDGKQIVKLLSEEWNKMNDKQKAKYQKLADNDRARYEKEKKAYDEQKANEASS